MKRMLTITALSLIALAGITSDTTAKKKTIKTGTYSATGDVSFKFKIYKGSCYDDKLKKKSGFCLSGFGDRPKFTVDCPDVKDGVSDHEAFGFIPNQKLLSKTGKIRVDFVNPIRTGESEQFTFNIDVGTNGKASGNLSVTETVKSLSVTSVCPSGKKKFTAKK
jgi:hypothetical protein